MFDSSSPVGGFSRRACFLLRGVSLCLFHFLLPFSSVCFRTPGSDSALCSSALWLACLGVSLCLGPLPALDLRVVPLINKSFSPPGPDPKASDTPWHQHTHPALPYWSVMFRSAVFKLLQEKVRIVYFFLNLDLNGSLGNMSAFAQLKVTFLSRHFPQTPRTNSKQICVDEKCFHSRPWKPQDDVKTFHIVGFSRFNRMARRERLGHKDFRKYNLDFMANKQLWKFHFSGGDGLNVPLFIQSLKVPYSSHF